MKIQSRKTWRKPELQSLHVEGVGNYQCTTGLQRVTVCNKSAGGDIGSVSCNQQTKNTVFS